MVDVPAIVDRALWAFRSRKHGDPGGAWGVHPGQEVGFEPIDWSVSRRRNQPAVAQVVIDPRSLTGEQVGVLNSMVDTGAFNHHTFGLSCFRQNFKEEDEGQAIFFGPVTAIDIPCDGPITLHAEDMMSLARSILVGTHDFKGKKPHEILAECQSEWVKQFPRASGLDFKSNVDRTIDYKTDIADLKTLYDVIQDLVGVMGLEVYHDRSIDLKIREQGSLNHPDSFEAPRSFDPNNIGILEGSSITRLFGPESQPNVIRVAGGDNTEQGRKVATTDFQPRNEGEFVTALAVQGSHGVNEGELKAAAERIRDQYRQWAMTASVRYPWRWNKRIPRPGFKTSADVTIPWQGLTTIGNELHHITVGGMIEAVTITQDFYDIELVNTVK